MRTFSVQLTIVVCIFLSAANSPAKTRAPETENERSLLYWRYLCENQPQSETIKSELDSKTWIEFQCPSQKWKVVAEGELVREVVDYAKK